jgi:hypothetical protein
MSASCQNLPSGALVELQTRPCPQRAFLALAAPPAFIFLPSRLASFDSYWVFLRRAGQTPSQRGSKSLIAQISGRFVSPFLFLPPDLVFTLRAKILHLLAPGANGFAQYRDNLPLERATGCSAIQLAAMS